MPRSEGWEIFAALRQEPPTILSRRKYHKAHLLQEQEQGDAMISSMQPSRPKVLSPTILNLPSLIRCIQEEVECSTFDTSQQIAPRQPPPTPFNQQQQTRRSSSSASEPAYHVPPQPRSQYPSASTQPTYGPPRPFPRTQMEAMPPFAAAAQLRNSQTLGLGPQQLDASTRHPVFFTERLKKAPAGVAWGGGAWCSPVAEGYVFEDGVARAGRGGGRGGEVKL